MARSKSAKTKLPDLGEPDGGVPDFSVEDSHAYYIYSLQSLSYAALAEALRPHDLNPPAWRVLANLQERDEVGVHDLARRTVVDVSNLSKLITAMTANGLLHKKRSAADARVALIYITDKGRRKFETALPAVRGVLDYNLAGFSDTERKTFLTYLRRMMKNAHAGG